MADIKVSQLPVLTNANAVDAASVPIVDPVAGELKQINLGQLSQRFSGVPDGGTTQQMLAKASNVNKDVYWKTISKNDVGLGQVDNTSDMNKPISTAVNAALATKANTSALNAKADTAYVNTQLGNKQDKLPIGNDGEVLTLVDGLPEWQPSSGGAGAVQSVFGRTGNVTAQVGDYDKTMIGLPNVDDTSDLDKPISNLTQLALNNKEDSLGDGNNGDVLTMAGGNKVWAPPPSGIPSGGTTGQALVKNSNSNNDVGWKTIESGFSISMTQTLDADDLIAVSPSLRELAQVKGSSDGIRLKIENGPSAAVKELMIQCVGEGFFLEDDFNLFVNEYVYLKEFAIINLIWNPSLEKWSIVGGL